MAQRKNGPAIRQGETPPAGQSRPDLPESTPRIPLWRALLLGVLLIPVNAFWVTIVEVRWYTLDGTSLPLFITPVFLLFVLTLLNFAWRKAARRPGGGLCQEELLLVYIMLVVSCTFAGHDTLQNLFGSIGHAYWNASPDNRWQALFFRYLPPWLLVTDHEALSAFYKGHASIYSPEGQHYLVSWIVPLAAWGALFLTLCGMYLCVTILVRRAWIENEKLTFPIVQLPLAMTAPDAGAAFFKNPFMWSGFTLAFLISGLNGLHELMPTVPDMNVKLFELQPFFTAPPWNAIGSTQSSFYPFAIGIAYFMPLDLSFSCWFFFLLSRVFRVAGATYGWNTENHGFPYFGEQASGAWLGLGVMLAWTGRGHWRSVFRSAWQGASSPDPAEARRYRAAFGGLAVGGLLLALFSALIGMSGWVAAAFFGIVLLLGFVITRVRAEFGAPHEINFVSPGQVLVTVFGTNALGAQDLSLLSMMHWFNRGYRNHPMPNQLEAFKMMDGKPAVGFAGLVGTLCTAFAVSLVSVYWANLHVTYAAGAGAKAAGFKSWVGEESFGGLATWLTQPTPPAGTGLFYIVGGFLIVMGLSALRASFVWWPLHPAGYALALSFAMQYFWLPVFIAWALKSLIVRYGGITLYRRMTPFFLGLILGDYTMGSLWAIIGPLLGIPTYKIYL